MARKRRSKALEEAPPPELEERPSGAEAEEPEEPVDHERVGDYLIMGRAVRGRDGDDKMRIGMYTFTGANVAARLWTYSAVANPPGLVSSAKFPGGAGSGPIRLPRYVGNQTGRGTWTETINAAGVRTLTLTLTSGDEVWRHTPDGKTGSTRYELVRVQGGGSFVRGYAFRTNRFSLTAPPAKRYWYASYPGIWCGTVRGVWRSGPSTFNQRLFTPTSSKVWYYPFFETSSNMWVFYALLFGEAASSRLIFYQSGGHDFNKDGIPNDLGHTTIRWAIYNDVTRKVEAVLGVECSYDVSGRAIAGVGYAQH
jgi:hypothetical protein